MKKKIVFRNQWNEDRYCVLEPAEDYTPQLEKVFGITKGYGMSVDMYEDKILIRDYFAGDTRAEFQIIAMEDSDLPVCLEQVKIEQGNKE